MPVTSTTCESPGTLTEPGSTDRSNLPALHDHHSVFNHAVSDGKQLSALEDDRLILRAASVHTPKTIVIPSEARNLPFPDT